MSSDFDMSGERAAVSDRPLNRADDRSRGDEAFGCESAMSAFTDNFGDYPVPVQKRPSLSRQSRHIVASVVLDAAGQHRLAPALDLRGDELVQIAWRAPRRVRDVQADILQPRLQRRIVQ